ncbi:MAG: hypothetical protein Q8K51_09935 [Nitrospirota bacterium]|nr:hypothetical protein [Nitrospirota bacterium]
MSNRMDYMGRLKTFSSLQMAQKAVFPLYMSLMNLGDLTLAHNTCYTSYGKFMLYGMPLMIMTVVIATIYVWLRYYVLKI